MKTVKKLAQIAHSLGHDRVMLVGSSEDRPREFRFLDVVTKGWRWLDVRIELSGAELQRELGQKVWLEKTRIYSEGRQSKDFADLLGKVFDLSVENELPKMGAVMFVTFDREFKVHFRMMPASEVIGPILRITNFGRLYG
jgi:hypothetical protein